jgi:formylglycine-generating enzyme required for sulfatase activity
MRIDDGGTQRRQVSSHPAQNVSWFDATAFCRWLSGRLGFEVRLPFEWEWEQAATGGNPGNTYPWGTDWDATRANNSESRLQRTMAVEMYPGGASNQGVLDLCGNVGEWCANAFDDPRLLDQKATTRVRRAVRGSRGINRVRVRSGARNYQDPSGRHYGVGFRVVCVSPIP